jgi:hypothetical protein
MLNRRDRFRRFTCQGKSSQDQWGGVIAERLNQLKLSRLQGSSLDRGSVTRQR